MPSFEALINRWVTNASTAELESKLSEYTPDRQNLSPRDVENRTRLAVKVQRELDSRTKDAKNSAVQ